MNGRRKWPSIPRGGEISTRSSTPDLGDGRVAVTLVDNPMMRLDLDGWIRGDGRCDRGGVAGVAPPRRSRRLGLPVQIDTTVAAEQQRTTSECGLTRHGRLCADSRIPCCEDP